MTPFVAVVFNVVGLLALILLGELVVEVAVVGRRAEEHVALGGEEGVFKTVAEAFVLGFKLAEGFLEGLSIEGPGAVLEIVFAVSFALLEVDGPEEFSLVEFFGTAQFRESLEELLPHRFGVMGCCFIFDKILLFLCFFS